MTVHLFPLWLHPSLHPTPSIYPCVSVTVSVTVTVRAGIPPHPVERQSEAEGPRREDTLGHKPVVSVAVTTQGNMQVRHN